MSEYIIDEYMDQFIKKEDNGYLFNLPCKPGDLVYHIDDIDEEIYEYKITDININKYGIGFENPYTGQGFDIDDFGKIVFLDEDRAKEELEKIKGVNNE